MESENELLLVAAIAIIKQKRGIFVQEIYKTREVYGARVLGNEMRMIL